MGTSIYYGNLQRQLFTYKELVEQSNSLNLSNDAINAENLFCYFLNEVFGWNLINANKEISNQNSFDLIDKKKGIVVQVTSNKNHASKRNKTIASFKRGPNNPKIKKLIILFISKDCKESILKEVKVENFYYEGYDISKLLKKVYHEVKSIKQLKVLNEIVEAEIRPVLINPANPINETQNYILPKQSVLINKTGIYIERKELIENIFSFAQNANGLLVGNPGIGKSFTLEELYKLCAKKKLHAYIIRINELIEGSDDELNRELNINTNWINVLKKVRFSNTNFKGILIFDAFDTAKDEKLKSTILKQIKRAINDLKNKWNILVSVRTFDAAKSNRLLELFPQIDITQTYSCRYFEVPELSEEEFNLAIKKNKHLFSIVQKSTDALKALLRTPYFLKLLERIINEGSASTTNDLTHIETEEQLLDIFWKIKVADNTEKDIFLRKLTQQLILHENLSCQKSFIITESNSNSYDSLISLGVITDSSITRQNISFSHNILVEFAVSKYLLSEDITNLFGYIDANQKIPFFFRQSFIYFYSKLWRQDNSLFWKHYFAIKNKNSALYRLLHQTILNYILAICYKTPDELTAIFNLKDLAERGDILRKILEGIRFIVKGELRDKDFLLLFIISEHMHQVFLWEHGLLIGKAVESLRKEKNREHLAIISKASLNYLSFTLTERKTALNKHYIEGNAGRWGIQNVCAIFPAHKQKASKKIKEILLIIKEPEFPIHLFRFLDDNIVTIFKNDRALGALVYKTIYLHNENSTKETSLGGSVIINLRSNRKQDFESIHYSLEQEYKQLLIIAPKEAISIGIEIVNQFATQKAYYGSKNKQFSLIVNGIKARLISDYSVHDPNHKEEHGPLVHLNKIFDYLNFVMNEGKESHARTLINVVIAKSHAAIIWRTLIEFLTNHPQIFKKQSIGILKNEAIFICNETIYEAGELIKVLWEFLTPPEKGALEKTIINLIQSKLLKEDPEFATRRVKRLLNCIPHAELTIAESRRIVSEEELIENKPLISSTGLQPYRPSKDEEIRDKGVDPNDKTELQAYQLIKLIEPFNNKYDYTNSLKPSSAEYAPLIPSVQQLFEISKSHPAFNKKLQFNCDYEVCKFIKITSRVATRLKKKDRSLIETIALFYIHNPVYEEIEYQPGNLKDRFGPYTPTPRTASAQTLVQLLNSDKSGRIAPLLLKLMSDNSSTVRLKALHTITYYWKNSPKEFWAKIIERSLLEKYAMCFQQLIISISYDDIIESNQNQVEAIALLLMGSLKDNDESAAYELWQAYALLLLKLLINYNSNIAIQIIHANFNTKEFVRQLLFEIISNIISPQVVNNIEGPNDHKQLVDILLAIMSTKFASIKAKGLKSRDLNDDFEIIDSVIQHLYFALEPSNKVKAKAKPVSVKAMASFYYKIKPILSLTVEESINLESGFMVAHTGYYFMQLLNSLIEFDPEYILSLSSSVVKCAAANGFTYEEATLKEVVKLTERMLADHKELLSHKEHFDSLLIILDLFASSGWQEAMELTWRLKEVF